MGSASSLRGLFPGGTWLTPAVPAFILDARRIAPDIGSWIPCAIGWGMMYCHTKETKHE